MSDWAYLSKVKEIGRRIGVVRVSLAVIGLILVVVFLCAVGVWDFGGEKYTLVRITGDHTCGIRTDGTLRCWGEDSKRPPLDDRFVDVAPGVEHACGLRGDGSVLCWGQIPIIGSHSRSPDPGPEVSSMPFTAIAAGGQYLCGLRVDGTAVCWGPEWAETRPCIARTNAAPTNVCWGPRGWGPTPPDGEQFTTISAGSLDACGLRVDGTAVCWGWYLSGFHRCDAVRSDGNGVCWAHLPRVGEEPLPEDARFKAISVGSGFACGIRMDDDILCWGSKESYPVLVSPHIEGPFTAVSSGEDHACALRSGGSVHCWGASSWHETDNYGDKPVSGERFVAISSGRHYNCGLRQDGTAKCWGGTWSNRLNPE